MRSIAKRVPALAFALLSTLAFAQTNVGELLDAGARLLSAEEFKAEIVQRTIVGLTPAGASIEVVHAPSGVIAGTGTLPHEPESARTSRMGVSGEWKLDDAGRVCIAMQLLQAYRSVNLPPRCQYWFKLGDAYFIADSDTDRRAKVLRRTLKP